MESKGALITVPQQFIDSSMARSMEECVEPEASTPPSTYGQPLSLNLHRKLFLSHSGKDKQFVRILHKDLCNAYPFIEVAFFDEKDLPKGVVVTMGNILEEARSSKLGVLVLTDAFFMNTRNPMLELEAFVDSEVQLLPLFLEMSVNEFKEKQRRDKWEEQWRAWAAKDDKLVIDRWRYHLDEVSKVCGIEYCMTATNWVHFIDIVVKEVMRIIGPAAPLYEDKKYGMDRLCEGVNDIYGKCASKRSPSGICTPTQVASTSANSGDKIDVVGIHGFPGSGKTTLCQHLCDLYYREFHGNVFYIELGSLSTSTRTRMEHLLSKLSTNKNNNFNLSLLTDNQVQTMIKSRFSSMTGPVFLALDDVLPDRKSQKEADFYMSCEFKRGSKVFITSRSEGIIRILTNQRSSKFTVEIVCMSALELDEATNIFEQELPDLHEARLSNLSVEEKLRNDVDAVLEMCNIHWKRYDPIMLKSLAAFVRLDPLTPYLDWKERLANLASEGFVFKNELLEEAFEAFDNIYKLLTPENKRVFLDLALYQKASRGYFDVFDVAYEWIKMLHCKPKQEREMEKILFNLQNLGFIEKKESSITIQDLLLLDYGKKKADAESDDQYLVVEDSDPWPDEEELPSNARHISIKGCREASRSLDLRGTKCVQVLHLWDNQGLEEVLLSRSTCAHLRSLIVRAPAGNELRCSLDEEWTGDCLKSLKWADLDGNIGFYASSSQLHSSMLARMASGSMLVGAFQNLEFLRLSNLPSSVQDLDVALCPKLKELQLVEMPGLKSIRGPENPSHLEAVEIKWLPNLQELTLTNPAGLNTCIYIHFCDSLEKLTFSTTPSSRAGAVATKSGYGWLSVEDCPSLTSVDGLLQYTGYASFEGPRYGLGISNRFLTETFGEMVKSAGVESALCKATVEQLDIVGRYLSARLAGRIGLRLRDAQHIGLFITVLFNTQPEKVGWLDIKCEEGADCGCDQNAPQFGTSPLVRPDITSDEVEHDGLETKLDYCCPKVKNLASLSHWPQLRELNLSGCTEVELWPDFAVLTSLRHLDLSDTSLKEWPIGVLHLPELKRLDLRGCLKLPAKEMIFNAITPQHLELVVILENATSVRDSLASLKDDLRDEKRKRSDVLDALDALSPQLEALFHRLSPSAHAEVNIVVLLVVEIMYHLLFGIDGGGDDVPVQELHIPANLKGLLCNESFLSLPYRASSHATHVISTYYDKNKIRNKKWNQKGWVQRFVDETPEYRKAASMAVICLMGIAVVEKANLSAYYSAALNEDVRDSVITFLKNTMYHVIPRIQMPCLSTRYTCSLNMVEQRALRERVQKVMSTMVREAADSGEDFNDACHHPTKPRSVRFA